MRELKRLIPFVWPYRRKFYLSCVFGVLVAALWGSNLTIVFPVMQVLLKEKTLQVYVDEEIAHSVMSQQTEQGAIEAATTRLALLQQSRVEANVDEVAVAELSLARHQDQLKEAQKHYYWMQKLKLVVESSWFPRSEYRTFLLIVAVVVVSTVVKGVFTYLQDVLVGDCAESSIAGVRQALFRKMLDLDYQTFAHEGTAGLMSRFTYDTELLSYGLGVIGGRFVREPLKCLACAGLAFWVNWRLTLLSLLMLPLIGVVFAYLSKLLKRAGRRMMESMSRIYRILEESFEGIKQVIASGTAHQHQDRYETEYQNYYKKALRVVRIDSVAKPMMELLGILSLFIALLPGAYLVLRHKSEVLGIRLSASPMSVEQLGLLYALLAGMLDPCRKMNASISRLRRSITAFERILETLDHQPKIADRPDAVALPRLSQSIEFRDVTFAYAPRENSETRGPVLQDFNLTVQAGEVVAIVGHNGCGKSTLVQLLPRFFDPQTGEILIDGVPIQQARLRDLRSQMSLVTQETILFDMTLAENIAYGSPDATQAHIETVSRQAHLGPILKQLPLGLDTPLGDKGKSLSGGQRQRVAIARAILRDPAILILDEATSATDAESESLIHQTLKEFVPGRTVLLITHSMSQSLLDFVTRIIVVDHGQVVADGAHHELLATSPIYQRLFQAPARRAAA